MVLERKPTISVLGVTRLIFFKSVPAKVGVILKGDIYGFFKSQRAANYIYVSMSSFLLLKSEKIRAAPRHVMSYRQIRIDSTTTLSNAHVLDLV